MHLKYVSTVVASAPASPSLQESIRDWVIHHLEQAISLALSTFLCQREIDNRKAHHAAVGS